MLLFDEPRRWLKSAISVAPVFALLVITLMLLQTAIAADQDGEPATRALSVGNWPARFGIVLVVDRLSALMSCADQHSSGWATLVYALARWIGRGRDSRLFLLHLVGLNGAFLTGDLFNLFVFFEVLLAASYGLLCMDPGPVRSRPACIPSRSTSPPRWVFLIGVSLIYGVPGT